jgi:hypothetical protein
LLIEVTSMLKHRLAFVSTVLCLFLLGCGGGASSPTVSSISPTSATVGDPVFALAVTGTNFTSSTLVSFGDTVLTPSSRSQTELIVTVPAASFAAARVIPVSVTGSSSSQSFTINNPVPALASLSLSSVTTGGSDFVLDVTGTKFVTDTTLNFGGVALTPSAITPSSLTVTVPASEIAKGRALSITAANHGPGGGVSNGLDFAVLNPLPAITSLSVSTVTTGSSSFSLDILGTSFVSDTTVNFGSLVFTPVSCTPTQMTVEVPASAISKGGFIRITASSPAPGGGMSNELSFTVSNPRPALSRISPPSVTAGSSDVTLTLTGSGFTPDSALALGDTPLTATFAGGTQITVVIPAQSLAQAGTATLTVTNPEAGGGDSNAISFTVRARAQLAWSTVVNNNAVMPNSSKHFNSYNTPSITIGGLVVFKGQSKGSDSSGGNGGGEGEQTVLAAAASSDSGPVRGIYTRRMSGGSNAIRVVTDNSTAVPAPNNTTYNGSPAEFIEFPSFPRVDAISGSVAFRGQHQPVYTYTLPDGTEARIGSAGVYTNPAGSLITGVGLMGVAPDYSYFQVPGALPGTRFDQFPGSPAITGSIIAFKGNYTESGVSKTGVFYRNVLADGGKSAVQLIANASTVIPNQPLGGNVTFGSTAPPTAVNGQIVFTAWDNEDNPTLAGIYLAPLTPNSPLRTLVGVQTQVPGEAEGTTFTQFGEGLSFDGRYVGFWASWGSETKTITLICPTDGNKDILAACNQMYPNGFQTQVPIHQGVFVYDTFASQLIPIAKSPADFDDFMYWVFSGRPPGVGSGGEGDDVVPEPPRWRSSAFLSTSGQAGGQFQIVFKAKSGPVDGIYVAQGPAAAPIETIVDTTMPAQGFDPEAPATAYVVGVAFERESFRGNWFVFSGSMEDPATTEGMAGVYVAHVPPPGVN